MCARPPVKTNLPNDFSKTSTSCEHVYKTHWKVTLIYQLILCKWSPNVMHVCLQSRLTLKSMYTLVSNNAQIPIYGYLHIPTLRTKREGPQSCNFKYALFVHFLNFLQLCKWSPNMMHDCSPLAFDAQIDVYLRIQKIHKVSHLDTSIDQV